MGNAEHLRVVADDCRDHPPAVAGSPSAVLDVMADFCDCLARMIERVESTAQPGQRPQ
jgi:hypothetical protein